MLAPSPFALQKIAHRNIRFSDTGHILILSGINHVYLVVNGYQPWILHSVKLKPFLQRRDGSAKGDWDVGITLDMIEISRDVDVVVLASGDGDFDLVINKIRKDHTVSVEVYGAPDLTAASLIHAANRFIPIEGHLLLS